MQLRIENIGPIGSAVIDLAGLTVIGGWNDTGKSTIGKSLFAIVKSVRNRELEYAAAQRSKVDALNSDTTSSLRRISRTSLSPSTLSLITRRYLDIEVFDTERDAGSLDRIFGEIRNRVLHELETRANRDAPYILRADPNDPDKIDLVEQKVGLSPEIPFIIEEYIESLRGILSVKKDQTNLYATSFGNMLKATFRGQINNRRTKGLGRISLSNDSNTFFDSTFQNDLLNNITVKEEFLPELFEDATLLESPFVLNSRTSPSYLSSGYEGPTGVDYTTHDLLQKLTFASSNAAIADLFSPREQDANSLEFTIATAIGKAIHGRIYFDQKADDFIFLTDDKVEVKIANTASGVKTLGILQMLASSGVLSGTNLLIIDEPEVHLHPEWQLVCANVVATLVAKYNVYCVISSHSPYFLQAIEAYSSAYKIEHLTKFYLSEKVSGICNFRDVTQDTEPLYSLLAEPMKQILHIRAENE